ncbi:Claudin-4 [Microtus ochrogaster]|uniref:Claudin-4 n=1 Tax=Microtus ochrogaster TaxID=79684 RepID=A0A8J6GDQ0_MICOH|nr:Claudin-4 [Microtus ochrogaster]
MARQQLEVASTSLVRLGWLVTIICCALPFWRGTEVSEEIIIWEGLWDVCEAEGLEILRCVKYSRMTLPQDIQVSRVLVVTCIVITWMGLVLDSYRRDKTSVLHTSTKEKMMVVTSALFLGLGVLLLVSVSWITHNVIHGNSLSLLPMETMMGVSLYLGWLSSLLLLLGGALLGGAYLWYKAPTNNDQPSLLEGSNNGLPSSSEDSRDGSSSENNA